jgi:hypothetical protein
MKGMQFQFLTKNNREYRNHKMGNPEKLATLGTQDDENQNKNNPEKLLVYPMLPVSLDCFCFGFRRLVYPMLPVSLDCFCFGFDVLCTQ